MEGLFLLSLWLVPIALWGWSGVWVYGDAERRGKPPLLVCVLVLLISWPISLLVWIALRPPERKRFNLEDFRVQ